MTLPSLSRKNAVHILAGLLFSALLIRLVVAACYENTFDTFWYKGWAEGLQNGIFDIYKPERAEAISLDYPPLYLFPLYLVGLVYKLFPVVGSYMPYEMLVLKFFPILFDLLCAWVLYRVCRNDSEWTGLLAAALWMMNPSQFFNTAFWGQTDQTMAFFLVLSFTLFDRERPLAATLVYAVASLVKFQCLLFAPVVLLELFFHYDFKKAMRALLSGIGLAIVVFIPFIIGSGNLLLPFEVYLGGFGQYPYCTLNACNLYGLLGLNWTMGFNDTETFLFGRISYHMLSTVLLVLIVVGMVLLYKFQKRQSIWISSLILMQSVFMLTTRMHERYQIAVLPFALMACIQLRSKKFFWLYQTLSAITLLNQAVLLFRVNLTAAAPWLDAYEPMIVLLSAVNVVTFVYGMVICLKYLLGNPQTDPNEKMPDVKECYNA